MIRLGLLLVCASACTDDGGPRLESATPGAARANATITLTGTRLCGADADCAHAAGEILLGISPPQVRANVTSYADDRIELVVPTIVSPGATHLIAVVDERSSNALAEQPEPPDRLVAEHEAHVAIGDLAAPAAHRGGGHLLFQETVGNHHTVEPERGRVQ